MTSINLSPDTIDDLIYSARIGDLAALQEDISAASTNSSSSQAVVIASAVDSAPEAEGGSGSCLLHFPAANGNIEILNYLLQTLQKDQDQTLVQNIVNHRNHSGNTPLHWAALNSHLDCVKALVEAGADVSTKNDAGLDAVFLAERTAWSTGEVKEDDGDEEAEAQAGGEREGEGEESNAGPMSKGRQVAEWLLSSDKGGELESGVAGNEGQDASGSGQK